mmetsp:Transcript_34379/g.92013  ORF Transcript_34379/g.92013 Transcript_34379/m.92013 type:complete len:537 (-) Transcript_34379:156-1766(-)
MLRDGDSQRHDVGEAGGQPSFSQLATVVADHAALLRVLRGEQDALRAEVDALRRMLERGGAPPKPANSKEVALPRPSTTRPARSTTPVRQSAVSSSAGAASPTRQSSVPRAERQAERPARAQSTGKSPVSPSASRRETVQEQPAAKRDPEGGNNRSNSLDGGSQLRRSGSREAVRPKSKERRAASESPARKRNDLYDMMQPLLQGNTDSQAFAAVERALRAGASPHKWRGPDTPLRASVEACRIDLAQLLLRERANPKECDDKGVSLLHLAAFAGHAPLCRLLMGAKAEVNCVDQHGQTPMFFAPTRTVCETLHSRRADTNMLNHKGQSALHLASRAGLSDVLLWLATHVSSALLDLRDMHGATAAYYAKLSGVRAEIYQQLQRWPASNEPGLLDRRHHRSGDGRSPKAHLRSFGSPGSLPPVPETEHDGERRDSGSQMAESLAESGECDDLDSAADLSNGQTRGLQADALPVGEELSQSDGGRRSRRPSDESSGTCSIMSEREDLISNSERDADEGDTSRTNGGPSPGWSDPDSY